MKKGEEPPKDTTRPECFETIKVFVNVPSKFLEAFDKATRAGYTTRSEAIRRGMTLVLRETNGLEATLY